MFSFTLAIVTCKLTSLTTSKATLPAWKCVHEPIIGTNMVGHQTLGVHTSSAKYSHSYRVIFSPINKWFGFSCDVTCISIWSTLQYFCLNLLQVLNLTVCDNLYFGQNTPNPLQFPDLCNYRVNTITLMWLLHEYHQIDVIAIWLSSDWWDYHINTSIKVHALVVDTQR